MAISKTNGHAAETSPLLAQDVESEASSASSETLHEIDDGAASVNSDYANQSIGSVRVVLIILSLWLLIFLQASNMSGLTTAQSTIAADLDSFAQASWFTSAYLIATSSIAPLAGRLSQLFSPRKLIFVSATVFSLGGFIASQARTFWVFIAGRIVQGVGAAGILTISIILVLELTGKKRRGLFIGLVNAGYTSGIALGALISGSLVDITGWRPLFWAQTPLALLAGLGTFLSIPKTFTSGTKNSQNATLWESLAEVDYFGAVTLSSSIVLFLYGMASPQIQWLPIAISACTLTLFVLNEVYIAHTPIIPVQVLVSRGVLMSCAAQLGFMMARWTLLFYGPVYAIAVRGWSPASAGSVLIPTNFGFGIGGLLVGGFHIKRGESFYFSCLMSMLLSAMALFLLSRLATPDSSVPVFLFTCFLNGLSTGAALNYTLSHLLFLTSPPDYFIVTGMIATFRGFAGSFGTAIGSGIFLRVLQSSLKSAFKQRNMHGEKELIRKLLGSPALVRQLVGAEREVAIFSYEEAVQTLFLTASGLGLLVIMIQAGTGWSPPESVSAQEQNQEEEEEDDEEETLEEEEEEERANMAN